MSSVTCQISLVKCHHSLVKCHLPTVTCQVQKNNNLTLLMKKRKIFKAFFLENDPNDFKVGLPWTTFQYSNVLELNTLVS